MMNSFHHRLWPSTGCRTGEDSDLHRSESIAGRPALCCAIEFRCIAGDLFPREKFLKVRIILNLLPLRC